MTSDNRRQLEQIAQLQRAIDAYRQGVRSGIPTPDADLHLGRFEAPRAGARDTVAHEAHAEYELLEALMRVYGDDLMSSAYFGQCLILVAQ